MSGARLELRGRRELPHVLARSRKRSGMFFAKKKVLHVGMFLIPSAHLHVQCTGRTCGGPREIDLTAIGAELNCS